MPRTLLALVAAFALFACRSSTDDVPSDAAPHLFGAVKQPVKFVLTGDSADAATGTVIGPQVSGLENYDFFTYDAKVTPATGGPTDVYLQKLVASSPDVWVDFLHFATVASDAGAKAFNVASDETDNTPVLVGTGTDDAATPALAANLIAHGHPGTTLRLVTVTGGSVTGSAVVTVYITGRSRN